MSGFAHVKRLALFLCLAGAFVAVSTMPSRAAMNSYAGLKGQKSGQIKGSVTQKSTVNVTQTPKVSTHVTVHPVVPSIKVK
jgi:hypothetical protein